MAGKPRFVMCICTGECPGFKSLDLWQLINRVRTELDVEYAIVHPQLCVDDGDRFWHDFLRRPKALGTFRLSLRKIWPNGIFWSWICGRPRFSGKEHCPERFR
jgi:hypothetical protein